MSQGIDNLALMTAPHGRVAHLFDLSIPHVEGRALRSRCGLISSERCSPAIASMRPCAKCAARTHRTYAEFQTATARSQVTAEQMTEEIAETIRKALRIVKQAVVLMADVNGLDDL